MGKNFFFINISNVKSVVKIDLNYYLFCKKDENCIVRSLKFFSENNYYSVFGSFRFRFLGFGDRDKVLFFFVEFWVVDLGLL